MTRKKIGPGGGPVPGTKGKSIADAEVGGSTSDQLFTWDASLMDTGVSDDSSCGWTWRLEPGELKELMEFLAACSKRTWAELYADRTGSKNRHKKHHDHDVSDICQQAQARLGQLTDESYDKILRLRYGGEKRLWGFRDRAVFHVVWVDLHHDVYPTDPN